MSILLGKVVSLMLTDRFGPVTDAVGSYLYKNGSSPMLHIKKSTGLPLSRVKEALCILIKYGLADFKPNRNPNIANYSLDPTKVMLILRYPKYINLIKNKFGEESEIILEEVLHSGYASASDLIIRTHARLEKDGETPVTLPELRDKFQSLVIAKYLERVPVPAPVVKKPDQEKVGDEEVEKEQEKEKPVPEVEVREELMYLMPTLDLKAMSEKVKGADHTLSDAGIYWRINHDRFHQDMRDKLIVNAVVKKFDENAGELIRILLQQMYIRTAPWADVSNPVPIIEVKDLVKKMNVFPQLVAFFDQYVNVIEQDSSSVIRKAGEASGGSFQIFIKDIFTQLTWETIEQIVLEKFDSKAARIFRLVKSKNYIEPEQIQKLAMIPAKEAKRLSYQLLEENFLAIQELKKAVSNSGPTKSFTLFHIQLDQVVRMAMELCFKALYNVLTRRNNDKVLNKRIIDKKQRVDTITLSMKTQGATEEQLADIEEMITPPEKELLEKIEKSMKKLNTVELEIDDTIFLLELYLAYE